MSRPGTTDDLAITSSCTKRRLFLKSVDIHTIIRGWNRLHDKQQFANNVFGRLFLMEPDLENLFEKMKAAREDNCCGFQSCGNPHILPTSTMTEGSSLSNISRKILDSLSLRCLRRCSHHDLVVQKCQRENLVNVREIIFEIMTMYVTPVFCLPVFLFQEDRHFTTPKRKTHLSLPVVSQQKNDAGDLSKIESKSNDTSEEQVSIVVPTATTPIEAHCASEPVTDVSELQNAANIAIEPERSSNGSVYQDKLPKPVAENVLSKDYCITSIPWGGDYQEIEPDDAEAKGVTFVEDLSVVSAYDRRRDSLKVTSNGSHATKESDDNRRVMEDSENSSDEGLRAEFQRCTDTEVSSEAVSSNGSPFERATESRRTRRCPCAQPGRPMDNLQPKRYSIGCPNDVLLDDSRRSVSPSFDALVQYFNPSLGVEVDRYELNHVDQFVDFWDKIVACLENYRDSKDLKKCENYLLPLIWTLGHQHSSINRTTFDGRVMLCLKSAVLEELLQQDVPERRQRIRSNSSPNTSSELSHRIQTELGAQKGQFKRRKSSVRRCQIMRAWYKLISFVLAEAKDAYLSALFNNRTNTGLKKVAQFSGMIVPGQKEAQSRRSLKKPLSFEQWLTDF